MTRARDLADSADKDIAGTVTLDDIILSNDITLADNGKAIFGAGSDLQIYSDGTNGYIEEAGGGNLRIITNGPSVAINKGTVGGENMAVFNADGAVQLFYDNSQKLATTSTGVDITGTLVSDGLTVDGNVVLNDQSVELGSTSNSYNELRFFDSVNTSGTTRLRSSAGILETYTSNAKRMSINSIGDITFYDTDGTTASFVYDASAGSTFNEAGADRDFRVESDTNTHMLFVDGGNNRIGINDSTPQVDLHVGGSGNIRSDVVGGKIGWGSGSDAAWYSYIASSNDGTQNVGLEFFTTTNAGVANINHLHMHPDNGTIFNETGADLDFRVDSDANANMFVVDASANCVNIGAVGSTTTNYSLFVRGNNRETGTNTFFVQKIGASGYSDTGAYTTLIGLGVEPNAGWSKGAIGWTRTGAYDKGHMVFLNNSGTNNSTCSLSDERMRITSTGVSITGSLSKSSGSFRIPHPVASKTETHDLVHSFVEAPQADNIYRGKVDLVAGQAAVNIDMVAGMTEGTFATLNREIQCFTSNETGWTAVRGSVSGNILTIEAQDNTCTDTVSWLVVGERQDQHMYDTDWTDDNGKVIVEPLKENA